MWRDGGMSVYFWRKWPPTLLARCHCILACVQLLWVIKIRRSGETSETSECGNFSFLEPSLVGISDLVGEWLKTMSSWSASAGPSWLHARNESYTSVCSSPSLDYGFQRLSHIKILHWTLNTFLSGSWYVWLAGDFTCSPLTSWIRAAHSEAWHRKRGPWCLQSRPKCPNVWRFANSREVDTWSILSNIKHAFCEHMLKYCAFLSRRHCIYVNCHWTTILFKLHMISDTLYIHMIEMCFQRHVSVSYDMCWCYRRLKLEDWTKVNVGSWWDCEESY